MDRGANRQKQFQPFPPLQARLVTVHMNRLTANELHHEVGQAFRRRAAVDQGGDIGMFEAGGNLPFAAELAHHALQVEAALHHFDRYLFVERLIDADAAIDGAHTTVADELDDLVRPQPRTEDGVGRLLDDRHFQEITCGGMRFQEGIHLLPNPGIAFAGTREVGGALVRLQPQRDVQDFFYPLPAFGMHRLLAFGSCACKDYPMSPLA